MRQQLSWLGRISNFIKPENIGFVDLHKYGGLYQPDLHNIICGTWKKGLSVKTAF